MRFFLLSTMVSKRMLCLREMKNERKYSIICKILRQFLFFSFSLFLIFHSSRIFHSFEKKFAFSISFSFARSDRNELIRMKRNENSFPLTAYFIAFIYFVFFFCIYSHHFLQWRFMAAKCVFSLKKVLFVFR